MGRTVRIKKSKELKEKDFYQTHYTMVESLNNNFDLGYDILDPCAGTGVIGNTISCKEIDLYPQNNRVEKFDFLEYKEKHKTIVMNPPYSNKYNFIDHALELADTVYVLLPLDTSNYNIFHKDYLDTDRYKGRLLMTPKIMLSDNDEFKRGGNTSYAWYVFGYNKNNMSYEMYDNITKYLRGALNE